MALSRTQRQRASRASTTRSVTFSPRIDAFGTVKILDVADYKARVVEYAPGRLAIFRDVAPTVPTLIELTSDINIKGRIMRTSTLDADNGEIEIVFQKAGCGCETPQSLRGGRNALIKAAGIGEAE